MKKVVAFILITMNIAITSCFGSTWVQLDNNNFIDRDSIKIYRDAHGYINYNKRIFWTKYEGNDIYKDLEKATNKKIEYGLSQYIVDFDNNTIATKAGMTYDKDGNPVTSFSYQDFQLEYRSIAPNSNAEYWAELVKKPRLLKKIYKWQQSQHQ